MQAKPKCLVIAKSSGIVRIITEVLSEHDTEVTICTNPDRGRQLLCENYYELLVIERSHPAITADAVEELKRAARGCSIVSVVSTGSVSSDADQRDGICEYCLVSRVRAALGQRVAVENG